VFQDHGKPINEIQVCGYKTFDQNLLYCEKKKKSRFYLHSNKPQNANGLELLVNVV